MQNIVAVSLTDYGVTYYYKITLLSSMTVMHHEAGGFQIHISYINYCWKFHINKKDPKSSFITPLLPHSFKKPLSFLLINSHYSSSEGLCGAVVAHSAHNRESPGLIHGRNGKIWAFFMIPPHPFT